MEVMLNGNKVKKVKDRTEGILYIQRQKPRLGQWWEVCDGGRRLFRWHVMEAVDLEPHAG